jgi:hypothetical protein
MATNLVGVKEHPLGSQSKPFNEFVEGQQDACTNLESGKITAKEFNRRYQDVYDTYLKKLGIMYDPTLRH